MEKFKLKISKSVEEEHEISLPHYRKGNCHAYKIYNKDNCISICHGNIDHVSIQISHAGLAFNNRENTECTKEEFEILYNEVQERLNILSKQP